MFVYYVELALASFRRNTLLRLLSDEVKRRDSKQLDARIRRTSFDGPRSIDRGTNPVGGSRGSRSDCMIAVVADRSPDAP
jgi:hypothetical protein